MAADFGGGVPSAEDKPDAVGRGWVEQPNGSRETALFVLSGNSLGIDRTDVAVAPEWHDLRAVKGLDALGEPVDGAVEIEMVTEAGRAVHARWPASFCDRVVENLMATIDQADPASPAPSPPSSPPPRVASPADPAPAMAPIRPPPVVSPADPGPSAPMAPAPAEAPPPAPAALFGPDPSARPPSIPEPHDEPQASAVEPAMFADAGHAGAGHAGVGHAGAPDPPPADADPRPADAPPAGSTALVLEDVVYLGGYPGQTKKRKKCTATLTRDGVEVEGAGGMAFRVSWDVVRTIETQNADEARFRMNTKVHRDATALVVECQQDVTILLEARDCPTIPLRTAITQLVADLRVVVV